MIGSMNCKRLGSLHWTNPATLVQEPLSAGSGLLATARSLWVVADDLNLLVRFDRADPLNGQGFAIFSGDLPDEFKARKRAKPDAECLFQIPSDRKGVSMVAFPSASKPQRNRAAEVWINDLDELIGSAEHNISALIEFLDKRIRT